MNFFKKLEKYPITRINPEFIEKLFTTLKRREEEVGIRLGSILKSAFVDKEDLEKLFSEKEAGILLASHAMLIKFYYPIIEQLDTLVDKEIDFFAYDEREDK